LDLSLLWGIGCRLGGWDDDGGGGNYWLGWAGELELLAADLVTWVVDGLAVKVAALQSRCGVQVEEVWARLAAELVVAVVLSGTAAIWLDVGVFESLFEVVVGVDDYTAGASLVGGIVQVGTAALVVGAGLSLVRSGVWDGEVRAADVVGRVKQAGTAARQAEGIGKNSSVTADAGEGIVGSVGTA
jgi:hypothetical protein